MLRLAIDTHIITSHFALPLLIKNPGGLVVEMTDGTADYNDDKLPRVALLRSRQDLGRFAWRGPRRTSCGRIGAPPSRSPPAGCVPSRCSTTTASTRRTGATRSRSSRTSSSPKRRATSAARSPHLAADPDVARWSGQSLSSGQLAKVYGFTDLDGSQPDAWRYVVEVQDAGKPADATGYR